VIIRGRESAECGGVAQQLSFVAPFVAPPDIRFVVLGTNWV
jgi:hypothetical protein